MSAVGDRRQGLLRFAVVALITLTGASSIWSQPRHRPPPSYVQPTPPDAAEGAAILERSRSFGLGGPYYLEFTLRLLPRSGEERSIPGRWLGGRNATGPISRLELEPVDGVRETILVQSGFNPAVWRSSGPGPMEAVRGAAMSEPLAGTRLTAADLATPFLHWTDHVYEGLARFRGRPTHVFLLFPPPAQAGDHPGIGGARVFIDTAYGAISQAQWVDAGGVALKTITVLGLKRIGERWIVKSFEVRDEESRDKTRLTVTGAILDPVVDEGIFAPDSAGSIADVMKSAGPVTPVR